MNAQLALEFIKSINAGDVDSMCNLMSDDHAFVDSQDNKVIGREAMRQAWKEYFAWFPDYHIEVNDVLQKENIVLVTGFASGTWKNLRDEFKSNYWISSAAFKLIVADGRVKLWQIFADASAMMEVVKRHTGT